MALRKKTNTRPLTEKEIKRKKLLAKEKTERRTIYWCQQHKGSNGYFSPMEREYLNQSTTVETQDGKVKGQDNWLNRHFYKDERSEQVDMSEDMRDEFINRLNAKVHFLNSGGHLKKRRMSAPPIQSSKDTEEIEENPIYKILFFLCIIALIIILSQTE